jgi:hypothetical protein
LPERVDGAVASFTGGGAHDRDDVHAEVAARHPRAAAIVPPCASAGLRPAAETAPTQHDLHLRRVAERGRMGWQQASGDTWHARVEAGVSRRKRVLGAGLRPQRGRRQATEGAITAGVLNRMLAPGQPEYSRIT